MYKVSIIVPVYNSEKYLDRCINSILKQSFKNFKLILINDGSTDSSLSIIKKYSRKDKRIIIIDQKNSGPAIARNNGIKKANSKYIMFIDSDDYIDNNYLQAYYEKMNNSDYDLVIGGYKKVHDNKIDFVRKLNVGEFSKYIVMAPYCKLYSTNFIKKYKIFFLNTNASEDIYFNESCYSHNPKVGIIDNIGYNYNYNPNSISNTTHKGFNKDVDILKFVNSLNFKGFENKDLNEYFLIRYLIWYLLYSGKTASKKEFIDMHSIIFKYINEKFNLKNKYLKKKPKGEEDKLYFIIRTYLLLDKLHLIGLFSSIYCKG